MAGFPNRPSRDAFGPEMEDALAVENPKQDIGAGTFNLGWWQLAGQGRVVPRAVLGFTVIVGPVVGAVTYQGLAWDPNAVLAPLAIARTGVGIYQIPFAASYPDELGTSVALALVLGLAAVLGAANLTAKVNITAPNTAEVRVFDSAGAPADPAAGSTLVAALW